MPDVDWSSVIPTLIGVIIGGGLTLVSSMFVSAGAVRRERRQRIYEELLDELDKFTRWGPEDSMPGWLYNGVWPRLEAVRRSADLTGPAERRAVGRIVHLYRKYRVAQRAESVEARGGESEVQTQDSDDMIDDLDKAVEQYRRLLARKIRRSFL
jgi:hypothetical protein